MRVRRSKDYYIRGWNIGFMFTIDWCLDNMEWLVVQISFGRTSAILELTVLGIGIIFMAKHDNDEAMENGKE